MFERFTDRTRRVLVLAGQDARALNHDFIGTEHLLLGLIHEDDGVAATALRALGITYETTVAKVEATIGRGGSAASGSPPFTPRSKTVLELSGREADQLGANYVRTEHLLLALIGEGGGVATEVLLSLGADGSAVRREVIKLVTGHETGRDGDGAAGDSFLQSATDRPDGDRAVVASAATQATRPSCAGCGADLTRSVAYLPVEVRRATDPGRPPSEGPDDAGPVVHVVLVYCTSCGTTLGSHDPPALA